MTNNKTNRYFEGEISKPFWDAVNEAEPEAGIIYKYGCLAQRMEAALIAAKEFIDSHVADPDLTEEMCTTYAKYKKAISEFEY